MSDSNQPSPDSVQAAYQNGRRIGLATGALAVSIISFLNLLAIEKSILAIVLALLAMKGAEPLSAAFRRGRIALAIATIHVVLLVVVLALFHDKLLDIVLLIRKLN